MKANYPQWRRAMLSAAKTERMVGLQGKKGSPRRMQNAANIRRIRKSFGKG